VRGRQLLASDGLEVEYVERFARGRDQVGLLCGLLKEVERRGLVARGSAREPLERPKIHAGGGEQRAAGKKSQEIATGRRVLTHGSPLFPTLDGDRRQRYRRGKGKGRAGVASPATLRSLS
jgi:hypothetical protein